MMNISFPYGHGHLNYAFDEKELAGVLRPSLDEYVPEFNDRELVKKALRNPIGSQRLCEMARDKNNIVIIASDHTRPVPSKIIIPEMLEEIRNGNPQAKITILIATGCHRTTNHQELIAKFGERIVQNETIYIHNCDERENLVNIGILPSGGICEINKIAYEADLLVAEGFIEPHFFAGFSGGRKSVLPGIAGRSTVLANHCAEFIANENARTGVLKENPIHNDMVWAAKKAKLAFIVNVVLNSEKRPVYAVAGDFEEAHKNGTDFLSSFCTVKALPADIVISTNGGYPLDQNVYQAVKGMTAAEATVKDGGVIIMLASSDDGIGGDHFYHQLADEEDINISIREILNRDREQTVPDQWQSQILLRILNKARVIYVSNMPDDVIEKMHMMHANSLEHAIALAKSLIEKKIATITVIPDGVSVIVR